LDRDLDLETKEKYIILGREEDYSPYLHRENDELQFRMVLIII
jgi:hypothetical protein